jgi:hypothetical protein
MIAHDEPRPSCHIYINITLIFTIFCCSSDIKSNHCFTFSSFALLFDKEGKTKKKMFQPKSLCIFSCLVFISLRCVQTNFKRSKHFAVAFVLPRNNMDGIKHINYECLMFQYFCAPLLPSLLPPA